MLCYNNQLPSRFNLKSVHEVLQVREVNQLCAAAPPEHLRCQNVRASASKPIWFSMLPHCIGSCVRPNGTYVRGVAKGCT